MDVNSRGGLGVLHFRELPFTPRRVYWLFDNPAGIERGWHAHKTLHQFIVCLSGSADVDIDDGNVRNTYRIQPMLDGLVVEPGHWRVLRNFAPHSLVLVMASDDYDPDDYIHDYEEFRSWKQGLT